MKLLQIYPQRFPHCEVRIKGNREGLTELVEAIHRALVAPCGEGETSDDDCLLASDGEGYQVEIKVMPDDWHDPAWDKRESEPCYYSEMGMSSEPSYYSGGAS